jgi:fibronectin type 3 domain-containing protein
MKKQFLSLILASVLLISQVSSLQVIAAQKQVLAEPQAAASIVSSLTVSSAITQWVLDSSSNILFTVSESGNSLLCINTATMKIDKTITLPGGPTDIIIDNSSLYIAVDSQNKIVAVDIATKTITKTIITTSDPYRIVIDGNQLYYTNFDQWCGIYEYNLISNIETKLPNTIYEPDLAVNKDLHILYAGESGSSGSNLYYFSTLTNKLIGNTIGYGFSNPARTTLFNGNSVIYAGNAFDPSNPEHLEGDYNKKLTVLFSDFGCVFTKTSIYTEDDHVKKGDFNSPVDLIECSATSVFTFTGANNTITKYASQVGAITSENIISIIGGVSAPVIPNTATCVAVSDGVKSLSIPSAITQWITDNDNPDLFAISSSDKALLFIDAVSFNLLKTIRFVSSPSDILLIGSDLYISLPDINQIKVVDSKTKTVTKTIYTEYCPYSIAIDGNELYYAGKTGTCNIHDYSLDTDTEKIICEINFEAPDLDVNKEAHLLYIGESGSEGSLLYYFNLLTNTIVGHSINSTGARSTFYDGGYVFNSGRAYDAENPAHIAGDYNGTQAILFSQFGCIFTSSSIYYEESYIKMGDLKAKVDLFECSGNSFYTYSKTDKKIIKYSPQSVTLSGDTILNVLSGTWAPPIPVSTESTTVEAGIKGLDMYSALTNWVADETGEHLYAISSADKAVFAINAGTLNIEGVLYCRSAPAEIEISGSSLYIVLSGINQIEVVDIETGDVKKTLYTSSEPYRIAIDGTKLYYANKNSNSMIYVYNLETDSDKVLYSKSFNQPDLAVNTSLHILYIGESGSSVSYLHYYNLAENKYIGKTVSSFNTPARTVLFDGQHVFYAGRAFDLQSPTKITGTYVSDESIKAVGNGTVFSTYQMFGENDFKRIYYMLDDLDLVLYSKTGSLFVYSEKYQVIMSFDTLSRYIYYALDKPSNVKAANASCTSIKLSWDEDYATGHYIYRSDTSTGKYTYIGKSTSTIYTNSSLTTGKKYYYKVIGYVTYNGKNVYGSYSSAISKTASPPAPASPKAVSASYNSIKVSWKAVSGATGYAIYRYNSSTKAYDKLKTTTATTYTNFSLSTGKVYYYEVKAYKTVGGKNIYSDYSASVSSKPVPGIPGSFKAVRISQTSIKVSWSAVSGATGYEVYRKDPAGPFTNPYGSNQYVLAKTTASTSFTNSGVFSGMGYYYYKVRAYRTVNGIKIYGPFSAEKKL